MRICLLLKEDLHHQGSHLSLLYSRTAEKLLGSHVQFGGDIIGKTGLEKFQQQPSRKLSNL